MKDDADPLRSWRTRRRAFVKAEILRFRIATFSLIALSAVAALFFAATAWRTFPTPSWEAIALLLIAVLCAAFPMLSKFSVSKDGSGFEVMNGADFFDRLEEKAEAARAESFEQTRQQIGALSRQVSDALDTGDATNRAAAGDEVAEKKELSLRDVRKLLPPPTVPEDPQKGRFGGSEVGNGRRLSATTTASDIGKKWRRVILTLASTDGSEISGNVAYFFLHDSFDPDVYRVAVKRDALQVVFKTIAMGAFTAGVVADGGATRLEIDLAGESVDAPADWKSR
jgi:hypothetical protein